MTGPDPNVRIQCIVPAAGKSRRMGRPKITLPYCGTTVAGAVVRSLLDAGSDETVVVTRRELAVQLGLPLDHRVMVTFNDDADSEMIDSIRIGLAYLLSWAIEDRGHARGNISEPAHKPPHHTLSPNGGEAFRDEPLIDDHGSTVGDLTEGPKSLGVLVVPADMPAITVDSYRLCLDSFRLDPSRIVIAACNDQRGHPVIFPISLAADIERLTGGLKELIHANRQRVTLAETNDPGVLGDLDTLADYERLNPR